MLSRWWILKLGWQQGFYQYLPTRGEQHLPLPVVVKIKWDGHGKTPSLACLRYLINVSFPFWPPFFPMKMDSVAKSCQRHHAPPRFHFTSASHAVGCPCMVCKRIFSGMQTFLSYVTSMSNLCPHSYCCLGWGAIIKVKARSQFKNTTIKLVISREDQGWEGGHEWLPFGKIPLHIQIASFRNFHTSTNDRGHLGRSLCLDLSWGHSRTTGVG